MNCVPKKLLKAKLGDQFRQGPVKGTQYQNFGPAREDGEGFSAFVSDLLSKVLGADHFPHGIKMDRPQNKPCIMIVIMSASWFSEREDYAVFVEPAVCNTDMEVNQVITSYLEHGTL